MRLPTCFVLLAALSACTDPAHAPLYFSQTQTLGVGVGTGNAGGPADVTFGFRSQNVAAVPTIAIDDVQQMEGDAGTTDFVFTVVRSGRTNKASTVDWVTSIRVPSGKLMSIVIMFRSLSGKNTKPKNPNP